jgi:hypothetical protein
MCTTLSGEGIEKPDSDAVDAGGRFSSDHEASLSVDVRSRHVKKKVQFGVGCKSEMICHGFPNRSLSLPARRLLQSTSGSSRPDLIAAFAAWLNTWIASS